jgi:hypothetical protein
VQALTSLQVAVEMNKHIIALLAAIALAIAIAAPVIATDRRAKAAAGKCPVAMKFDKRTKTCQKR